MTKEQIIAELDNIWREGLRDLSDTPRHTGFRKMIMSVGLLLMEAEKKPLSTDLLAKIDSGETMEDDND